ncbi:DNA gyrase inhibitor YacG [Algisphaera agarilytica]|uniref:DNA gyrase inhibitor YacG n=1 Tax=Algisphaera agarilytica TaxID=1385975 RepID=A0A7X0H377_9BACT|nr:DNA gyrase inhibitor YacG [Algisphaera agarilytica]MBB6428453.1 endogenous inhibitor of DNA gyrase (YacG/DUF329 family) [Algisphaera agarilytica]
MTDRNLSPKTSPCPTCKTPVTENAKTFPFCSARCQTIDLGRWFGKSYKVSRPIEQSDIEEGD